MGLAAAPVGNGRPATGDSDGAEATQHSPTKKPRRTATGARLALHESYNPSPGTKLTQHTPPHCMRGTKLALLAQNAPFWHVFRVQGELSTAIATNKPRMANFLPFSPARSRARRTLYRMRGRDGSSHHSTPALTGAEGAGGTGGPGCGARERRRHRQPNFARNLSWSVFETPQKRCNSNDVNSMFE